VIAIAFIALALVTTLIVTRASFVIIQDHESGNHSWHPSAYSEQQGDDDRSAALVIYGEGREDDAGYNS